MTKFLTLFLLCSMCNGIWAGERSLSQKQEAAASVLNKVLTRNSVQEIVPLQNMDQLTVMGYENDDGFAVIANDDKVAPILGYCYTTFDTNKMPDGLKWWLQSMDDALETRASQTEPINIQKIIQENGFAQSVPALTTANWGQEFPFNQACPISPVTGTPCLTGCIATAMGEIMQYYKWPEQGTGSYSYEWTSRENKQTVTLSVNYGSTSYNWNLMPDNYDYPSEEQIAAVSQLMYHCGVAANMGYASDESGATEKDACLALYRNFNYSKNMQMRYRDKYNIDDWMLLVMRELNAGRPLLYSGSKIGAHAFVVDGYNADGLVHVNWGWTGRYNGMYDITLLNPADKQYSEGQSMIIGIAPTNEGTVYGCDTELYVFNSEVKAEIASSNVISFGSTIRICNGSLSPIPGTSAILLEDENGNLHELSTKSTNHEGLAPLSDNFVLSALWIPLPENLPDGTYHVYPAFRKEGETEWIRPRYDTNKNNECLLTKRGDELSVESIRTYISLNEKGSETALSPTVITEEPFDGDVYVYDLYGRCIYSAPAATFDTKNIPGRGIYLIKRGNRTEKIWKTEK